MNLVQAMGGALLCMALAPAASAVSWAETPASPSQPANEIFTQQVQPSVGGMQDPGAVTPRRLNGMTIHIKMTHASVMAMHHAMKTHPKMNCKIEPYEPGATFTMVLVCH
jgi:hypothetical protein